MNKPSSLVTRILGIYGHIRTQFFGIRLGQHTLLSLNETSIQFHYVVPSDVCRDNRMPCSTAVAVFDELSTIGFLALDKSHRPGVSVSLSARILADISAGDALTIDIFYDKMGRNLAFSTMTMRNERSNELVARGRHVKYLPISWAYDNIFSHSCLLSIIATSIHDKQSPTWLGKKLFDSFMGNHVVSQFNEEQNRLENNVFESFPLGRGANGNPEFRVQQNVCNPFGMLHGGAAAMIIENSVYRVDATNQKRSISQLDLTYLNGIALGRNAEIHFVDSCGSDAVHGSLASTGKVAVQFSILFE